MVKEGNKEKINLKRITYARLLNKTLEIYRQGDYLEAYNFITENYKGIKKRKSCSNIQFSVFNCQ